MDIVVLEASLYQNWASGSPLSNIIDINILPLWDTGQVPGEKRFQNLKVGQ